MARNKIKILGIAPYEGMYTAMSRLAEDYPQAQLDVYTANLEEGVSIVENTREEGYDVIISRGGTAELISRHTNIPVVTIELSVYDVLRAIKLAENYSNLYAIVGFSSITKPAHVLCDLLQYDVDIVTIHHENEVERTLERLRQGGYRMILGDMVTHTLARQMGFDAFLITSGIESLQSAIESAISLSERFYKLRQENFFLTRISREKEGNAIVLDGSGELQYFTQSEPSNEQLSFMRSCISRIRLNASSRFYQNENGRYYQVSARSILWKSERYYIFRYHISQIPLRGEKNGMRSYNMPEISQLFMESFYSISGAMGELAGRLNTLAVARQPIMIFGEPGTGKEQIARAIYLRSPNVSAPFWMIDCTLMNEKSWDYLLNHSSSPLGENSGTVCFKKFEVFPENLQADLLSILLETDISRRIRLLFTCSRAEGQPIPPTAYAIIKHCTCMELSLPSLRSRADEIPSLASLYIGSLNTELGKQIIGLEPQASEQLLQYHWPNNYTQFKKVLYELAASATSSYIRSGAVAECIARQRQIYHSSQSLPLGREEETRTLDEIIQEAIQQRIAANKGNQAAAARQLGISRTTLWRHIKE